MLEMSKLFLWVLQGSSGAVAGYITNKYAVNMLFKEYTPFKIGKHIIIPCKFGGVIKNRKEKFIEEISELVERDIINGKTLKNQISSDYFNDKIDNLSHTFFYTGLDKAFSDISLSEILGFYETVESMGQFTKNNLKDVIEYLVNNLGDKFKTDKIISYAQISYFVDNLYELLIKELQENDNIATTIKEFYKENSEVIISNIVSDDALKTINNNIESYIDLIIDKFFEDDTKIYDVLERVYELTELENSIDKFQVQFKEKSFEDFINEVEQNKLSENIFNRINEYLKDENGFALVEVLTNKIINISMDMDFSLYDLLPDDVSEKLSYFINESLKELMPYISEWILDNRNEFDKIIEDSINEALIDIDVNIKNIILSKVKEFFVDNIVLKNEIVNKITSSVNNYKLDDDSLEALSQEMINYLRNTKIKDVCLSLKNNNIIDENTIKSFSQFVINEFSVYGDKIINELLKSQISKKIGTFVKVDFKKLFKDIGKKKIYDALIKEKHTIKERFTKLALEGVNKGVKELSKKNISEIIHENMISEVSCNSCSNLVDILNRNSSFLKETLTDELYLFIHNFNFSNIIKNNEDIITNRLIDIQEKEILKYKNLKLKNLTSIMSNNADLSVLVKEDVIKYLKEHIEFLLDGKIKKIVHDNLIQFNEEEICDLAQKFMGNELKPLSLFGGGLGLIAGLIFGFFSKDIDLFGFYGSITQGVLSVILMGAIGVFTNVIAIEMLFRPYKKNKVLAKIPILRKFALGYIPAHKENLSDGIGSVIDNELLNGSKIKKLLNSKKQEANKFLTSYIECSNYKVLRDFIQDKKNQICNYIYKKITTDIQEDNYSICNNISNEICKTKVNKILKKNHLDNNILNKLKVTKESLQNWLITYLEKKINSEIKLKDIIPASVLCKGEEYADNVLQKFINENSTKMLSEGFVKKLILNNESLYNDLTNKYLSQLIDEKGLKQIKEYGSAIIETFIFEDLKIISKNKVKKIFYSEVDCDKTIGTIFNGNFKNLINKNIDVLSDFIMKKMTQFLKEHKELISQKTKNEINSHLNFFEKMGYAMAGGDIIVDNCVSIAVYKKLPILIDMKFYEINELVQSGLNNTIYPVSVKRLKIKTEEINVDGLLDNIFQNIKNTNTLTNEIIKINNLFLNSVSCTKLSTILSPLNLDNIESLYLKFYNEIRIIRMESIYNLNENSPNIFEYCKKLLKNNLFNNMENVKIGHIMNEITYEEIKYSVEFILNTVYSSSALENGMLNIIGDFYDNKLNNKNMLELLNENILLEDIKRVLRTLSTNEGLLEQMEIIIKNIFDNAINNEFNFMDPKIKKELNERVCDALIISTISHTEELLKSANLKEVTYEQIKLMDSKEIYDLFQSFAGTFFKKLYAYGTFGAIFGINLWLPIAWAFKEYINGKLSRKNSEQCNVNED